MFFEFIFLIFQFFDLFAIQRIKNKQLYFFIFYRLKVKLIFSVNLFLNFNCKIKRYNNCLMRVEKKFHKKVEFFNLIQSNLI